MIIEDCWQRND